MINLHKEIPFPYTAAMHTRTSSIRGLKVVEDEGSEVVALMDKPLINPDNGQILGFFVLPLFFSGEHELFLRTEDIIAWGMNIHIRSHDALSPPEELIRLKKYLDDPRRMLGQSIVIQETEKKVGVCSDVQFDTRRMAIEWLFPRRYFFERDPIAVTEIIEVTPEAIIIRNPLRPVKEDVQEKMKIAEPALRDITTVEARNG